MLSDYKPLKASINVKVGDGFRLPVDGYGTLSITVGSEQVHFPYTLHVPGLKCNVLSVSALGIRDFVTVMDGYRACVYKDDDSGDPVPVLIAKLVDSLYLMDLSKQKNVQITSSVHQKHASYIRASLLY